MQNNFMDKHKQAQREAFTLADTLLTLALIAVVALMTVPSLLQGMQERALVAATIKANSTFTNAYTRAVQENGTPDLWYTIKMTPSIMIQTIAPYLNVTKYCGTSPGCFPEGVTYKYINGTSDSAYDLYNSPDAKAQLADGSIIAAWSYDNCNGHKGNTQQLQSICGAYFVDVNGFKPPNTIGKDMFEFYLTKYGIIPAGTEPDTGDNFVNKCLPKTATGWGCAAWVIYNGNLDYLYAHDLDWSTKTHK